MHTQFISFIIGGGGDGIKGFPQFIYLLRIWFGQCVYLYDAMFIPLCENAQALVLANQSQQMRNNRQLWHTLDGIHSNHLI